MSILSHAGSTCSNSQMQSINNEIAVLVKVSDDILNSQEFAIDGDPNSNTDAGFSGTLIRLLLLLKRKLGKNEGRAAYRTQASLAMRDRKLALTNTTST
ncbi:hypothetical protein QYF36_007997 [Acer negundo]|nr:hypothetical protein QYF36_007997 [Acer negundo]